VAPYSGSVKYKGNGRGDQEIFDTGWLTLKIKNALE
jgi:hypothetical protein